MSEVTKSQENFLQNLKDAGCDEETISQCMALTESKNFVETLRRLRQHKKTLLAKLHANQKEIDCLDYLIYSIEGQIKKGDILS